MGRFTALGILVVSVIAGCSRPNPDAGPTAITSPLSATADGRPAPSAPTTVLDLTANFDACTLGHRGVLLDMGDPTVRSKLGGIRANTLDLESREREGATWASVRERSLDLSVTTPFEMKSEGGIVVEARLRGGSAHRVSVYLGGKPVGTLPLTKGQTKVVSLRAPNASVPRGTTDLLLRFSGGGKNAQGELAEIDWIRVGPADGDAPYSAPTRSDALATVNLAGVARRGLSLRAPGWARCAGYVPSGAVLEGYVGVTGGEADAEVRVTVDRAEPRVVGTFHLGGPQETVAYRPVSLPLGEVGTLAAIELVAKGSSKGARVVFAEPRIVVPVAEQVPAAKPARGVVLVVAGTTSPKGISAYGGAIPTPELADLAASGILFDAHRASTSYANGSVASMFTGLGAREHGVMDPDATLGPTLTTIAEAARQGGVVTAMFTANPTTSEAHGFARGWETFAARSPTEEAGAVAVFEDAAKWLDAHKGERFLVVIHSRGGHPPWEASTDELRDLPPAQYAGAVDPKHGGEVLAKARRLGSARLFTDADRERVFALHGKAVAAHDAALGRLVTHLRGIGRDGDTAVLVTGDVGVDAVAHVPLLEEDALDESALAIPLVYRPAGGRPAWAAKRVSSPTTSEDVAPTILEALGLPPPPAMHGESISMAARGARPILRPTIATTYDKFSVRWAGFVLLGARDRETKLCNLSLEAECVGDVRATHPLAAELLHGAILREVLGAKRPAPPRVAPDSQLGVALHAWGR